MKNNEKDLEFLKEMKSLTQKLIKDRYDITRVEQLDQMISDWICELEGEVDNTCITCEYLYKFLYNSCIHESGWVTISLHYSKEGAEKAMNIHKENEYRKWVEYNDSCIKENPEFFTKYPNKFAEHESWDVQPVKVFP